MRYKNCCIVYIIQRAGNNFRIEKLIASSGNEEVIPTMADCSINTRCARCKNRKPILRLRNIKVKVEPSHFAFRRNKQKLLAL